MKNIMIYALLLVFAMAFLVATSSADDVSSVISESLFNQMLQHRNNAICPAKDFYTYNAFLTASRSFNGFGTTGDAASRKREIAAFFGQTSHETTGGTPGAADEYTWGYCFIKEGGDHGSDRYYGRGPIQLTHDYNYRQAGQAIGRPDLINNPDLVATDAIISFKTAIWYWMTRQANKPSCHDVITGRWTPSNADRAAGRFPGYGVITNIINGGKECGSGTPNSKSLNRVGFYKRYCDLLGLNYGTGLGCKDQRPFAPAP